MCHHCTEAEQRIRELLTRLPSLSPGWAGLPLGLQRSVIEDLVTIYDVHVEDGQPAERWLPTLAAVRHLCESALIVAQLEQLRGPHGDRIDQTLSGQAPGVAPSDEGH
ncbi:MAG: hypothetical protein AMXMBFR77_28170 [Phycisphaerales bacterium]